MTMWQMIFDKVSFLADGPDNAIVNVKTCRRVGLSRMFDDGSTAGDGEVTAEYAGRRKFLCAYRAYGHACISLAMAVSVCSNRYDSAGDLVRIFRSGST